MGRVLVNAPLFYPLVQKMCVALVLVIEFSRH